jgi:hypothetical protein
VQLITYNRKLSNVLLFSSSGDILVGLVIRLIRMIVVRWIYSKFGKRVGRIVSGSISLAIGLLALLAGLVAQNGLVEVIGVIVCIIGIVYIVLGLRTPAIPKTVAGQQAYQQPGIYAQQQANPYPQQPYPQPGYNNQWGQAQPQPQPQPGFNDQWGQAQAPAQQANPYQQQPYQQNPYQ